VGALRQQYGDYVLYFGRLSVEKGLPTLIEACSRAQLPLVLVGTGPDEDRLRGLAAQSASPAIFCGYKAGADLWALVDGAACVALPSICYENAPKTVLEAQARRKVAVVSDIGGLPELVEEGVSGLLARPGDPSDLARALSTVYAMTPSQRHHMGEEARRRLLASFSSDRYFQSMTSLYEAVVGNSLCHQ
jgi:glycosyltransferase involved in cell wall biosynthesis